MKWNLYKVKPKDDPFSGTLLIAAHSSEEAKKLHPLFGQKKSFNNLLSISDKNEYDFSVKLVGVAIIDIENGEIISF